MHKRFNVWFVIHAAVHILAITSIFWLPWYWLALIFVLLRVQDAIFGGCVLTYLEYGSWDRRWTNENIGRFLPRWMSPVFPFLIDWILPALLVLISYLIK